MTLPASLAGRGHKVYAATLTCAMVPALEGWMNDKVQTAAAAVYGQAVVEMHTLGSYSCRRMNNGTGTSMISEHAFADALDVSGFTLADGREVMVRSGWRGPVEDQEFLRSVFVGSCDIFHTVLGPGSDGHHEDHFHLDLMRHASGHHICRPVIKFAPRTAPALEAPRQAPVAPGEMQQEPEADDPYAFDDTTPSRGAVAAREPVEEAPRASFAQRPMPAMSRPQPAYVSAAPLPAARRGEPDDGGMAGGAPLPVTSKGDRLDRSGAPTRAASWQAAPGAGSSVAVKDVSRLGPAERPSPPSRPAYASVSAASVSAPRPPGLVPMPAQPPAPLAAPSRPAGAGLPPGWQVGAQPSIRAAPGRNQVMPAGGADDPDE